MKRSTRIQLSLLTLAGVLFFVHPQEGVPAGAPPVKEFSMVVQEKTIALMTNPKKEVTVWAYGLEGQEATVPGPVIRVQVGDRLRVRFKNTHTLPHTIHFHGTHPFVMDGNGQRGLGKEQVQMPGEEYTYEFTANEPGYYLYHCHFDTPNHVEHGMYGIFIVEDPAWPAVAQEWITIWDEWDTNGDGQDDAHTINSRSAPDSVPFTAVVGERIRLVMANFGDEVHSPHVHGQSWIEVDTGDPRTALSTNRNGVVSIAPAQIRVVEFTPRHEGTWLFHCHVLPHVNDDGTYPRGMLTRVVVAAAGSPRPPGDQQAEGMAQGSAGKPGPGGSEVAALTPTFTFPTGNAEQGTPLFKTHCMPCHGEGGKGAFGPKLAGNAIVGEPERYWTTVLNGRGNMPAWKERLAPQALSDILAYLKTLK